MRLRLTRPSTVAHSLLDHFLRGPGARRAECQQDSGGTELLAARCAD